MYKPGVFYPLFILCLLSQSALFGQTKLIFENNQLNEKYEVENGDYLKILYVGYLDQPAEQKSYISYINDSSIIFKTTKSKDLLDDDIRVRLQDIQGFKKLWKWEPIARPIITLGTTIGSYYYFDSDHFSSNEQLLYTTLVTVGTSLLLNFIFDDTIEYKMSDGWTFHLSTSGTP